MGKDIPFEWGPEQLEAQNKIIHTITYTPVLVKLDPSRQFELEVDTSQIGTGAILYQQDHQPHEQMAKKNQDHDDQWDSISRNSRPPSKTTLYTTVSS